MQDVPIAVVAFGENNRQKRRAVEVANIADYTPGLVINKQTANSSNMAIGIRGVAAGDSSLAIDPVVAMPSARSPPQPGRFSEPATA